MSKSPEYFLEKLSKTSSEQWTAHAFTDHADEQRDIYGHLGCHWTGADHTGRYEVSQDLRDFQELLVAYGYRPAMVCDGGHKAFPQECPRERILACLTYIRELGTPLEPQNLRTSGP